MVDALDARAPIGGVALQHRGGLLHADIELERHSVRIDRPQGAALERHLGERGGQAQAGEPGGRAIEILLARHLEAEGMDAGLFRQAQHHRMVIALLEAAQIERVRALRRHQVAETIDIEGARAGKIAHPERHMARPHDVEGWIEHGLADWHNCLPRTVHSASNDRPLPAPEAVPAAAGISPAVRGS